MVEKKGAVFLDRDGTINEEVDYLCSLDQLRIFPVAAEAIRLINQAGMKTVVVTNQSGVARGFFDEAFIAIVHDRIVALLKREGARIDRFYYCPHHPTEGMPPYRRECDCRKPNPGMLLRASRELDIDLARSYVIGDSRRDIDMARRVGAQGILVRTGHGTQWNDPESAAHVADDILDAVEWVMRKRTP